MHFPGQRPSEEILLVVRKHPIVYLRVILIYTIMLIIPAFIFLWVWGGVYGPDERITLIMKLFLSMYFLHVVAAICISWLNEEFDMFIITNERLIDITQVSFLKRTVASTQLDQIQDATSHVDGILPTILNYGSVEVQTAAGEASNFIISRVPKAANVSRKIMDIAHQNTRGHDRASI